jgi:ribosomal-protein-alanine N-acetyltransferase
MYYFIEAMVEADIPQVQEIERASCNLPWSSTTYRRELRNPISSRYLVARASPTPPPPRETSTHRTRQRARLFHSLFSPLLAPMVLPEPQHSPLVGYGGLWLTIDEAHITTLAVTPSHRERSVGELLLNGLLDQALDMNASHLTLEVRASNMAAQNLYLKYGFQPAGRRVRYYTDNGEDALIMWTDTITSPDYQARLKELRQQLFARLRAQIAARPDCSNESAGDTPRQEPS